MNISVLIVLDLEGYNSLQDTKSNMKCLENANLQQFKYLILTFF